MRHSSVSPFQLFAASPVTFSGARGPRQVLLLARCSFSRIFAMWGHLVQCHFWWKELFVPVFLVGPCINQHQIKWKYVVKLCKTLSRHTHFCLIIIQLRSVTDRVTLNQTEKNTWMLLPPSVNRSQWVNSDNHSWRAQTSWNFILSFSFPQGPVCKGGCRTQAEFQLIYSNKLQLHRMHEAKLQVTTALHLTQALIWQTKLED